MILFWTLFPHLNEALVIQVVQNRVHPALRNRCFFGFSEYFCFTKNQQDEVHSCLILTQAKVSQHIDNLPLLSLTTSIKPPPTDRARTKPRHKRQDRAVEAGAVSLAISASTANDGSFSWTITITQTAETYYKIRITNTQPTQLCARNSSKNVKFYPGFSVCAHYLHYLCLKWTQARIEERVLLLLQQVNAQHPVARRLTLIPRAKHVYPGIQRGIFLLLLETFHLRYRDDARRIRL